MLHSFIYIKAGIIVISSGNRCIQQIKQGIEVMGGKIKTSVSFIRVMHTGIVSYFFEKIIIKICTQIFTLDKSQGLRVEP